MSLAGTDGATPSPSTDVVRDHQNVIAIGTHHRHEREDNRTVSRYDVGPVTTRGGRVPPRRQVLTEEEYQSALDRIISRDYFPSVPSLRRDAAVLDARARGDVASAVAVRRAARRLERHGEAAEAEAGERLRAAEAGDDDDGGLAPVVTGAGMGLDEFHRRATSEDNAEFEEVQREEVRERRALFERAFGVAAADAGSDIPALTDGGDGGDGRGGRGRGHQLLLKGVLSGDRAGDSGATPLASEEFDVPQPRIEAAGARERPRNSLFFTPQLPPRAAAAAAAVGEIASQSDARSNDAVTDGGGGGDSRTGATSGSREQVAAAAAEANRLLMPPPAPVTMRQSQPHAQPQPQPRPLTSLPTKQGGERETKARFIQPSETRFPYQGESRLPPNSSSSRRDRQRTTMMGTSSSPDGSCAVPAPPSDSDTDLDAPTPLSLPPSARTSGRGRAGGEGCDAYVAMTPLIVPGGGGGGAGDGGGGGDPNASPIVTWGNVAGTPLVIGGEAGAGAVAEAAVVFDGQQPSFSLPAEDDREAAARVAEAAIVGAAAASSSSGRSRSGRGDRGRRRAPLFPSASAGAAGGRGRGPSASVADRAASLTPAARSLLDRGAGGRGGGTPLLGSSSTRRGKGTGVVDARMGSALRSALRGSYVATPRPVGGRSSSSTHAAAAAASTPRSTPQRRKRDDGGGDAGAASPSPSSSKRSRTARGSGRRSVVGMGHITDGLLRLDG